MMKPKITKAVFPVAGMGTRFLPATKANPKEMLPIVDKPLIQYAVEEAVSVGIKELIFVTSSSKRAIEDHFDSNYELEAKLAQAGKQELLAIVQEVLPRGVNCAYIRQPDALGLGHAVLCAKPLVGQEPFAVLLADDLIDGGKKNCLAQMLSVYEQTGSSVIAVEQIPPADTRKYGVVKLAQAKPNTVNVLGQIQDIIEKPHPEQAPSNLGVVGRYILEADIFNHLEQISAGAGGELQLTDAIARLLQEKPVFACRFHGKRYDCGNKLGYLQATIAYALQHPDVGQQFADYLSGYIEHKLVEQVS